MSGLFKKAHVASFWSTSKNSKNWIARLLFIGFTCLPAQKSPAKLIPQGHSMSQACLNLSVGFSLFLGDLHDHCPRFLFEVLLILCFHLHRMQSAILRMFFSVKIQEMIHSLVTHSTLVHKSTHQIQLEIPTCLTRRRSALSTDACSVALLLTAFSKPALSASIRCQRSLTSL